MPSYGLYQQIPPIRVYPPNETAFTTNGLRCLFPQSAEVTLQEQQAHSIRLVHPVDDGGAWKALQRHNILYVPIERRGVMTFQPMRIYKVQKQRQNGGSTSITVDAKHVFYDLNSVIVSACSISSLSCSAAITKVFQQVYRPTANAQASDSFSYSTDITATASAEYDNITATSALIGDDNSIASLYGGELYVDGFRFSINSRMEGAQDDAFKLAYGINMTGITATYDSDAQYSAVVGVYGTNVQTRIADAATCGLPFDRAIYAKFSYKSGTPDSRFSADLDSYANTAKQVNASYSVTFADLSTFDEYSGFSGLSTFEVGDTGTVYDEDLDIITHQKIVEKKIDVLTQTVLSVKLGSIPASITQQRKFANTVTNTMTAEEKDATVMQEEIAASLLPRKYESGQPPLTVTAQLTAPVEVWGVYGNTGGVGDDSGVVNIYNKLTVKYGKFLNSSSGAEQDDQKYNASDFIKVSAGNTYSVRTFTYSGAASYRVYYYKSDKTYISRTTSRCSDNANGFVFTVPNNCAYIRLNFESAANPSGTQDETTCTLERGNHVISQYSPFLYNVALKVNGTDAAVVLTPQLLYFGDYFRRAEGGIGTLYLVNDPYGEQRETPVEQSIDVPYFVLPKGTDTLTVSGSVVPFDIELIYR